jgi:DNA-binding transcriptional LysR family regulator
MDLRQLRCFIAVAEELHFGRAAEKLGLAPPALSRQIGALESELGVALLIRTTRQVSLTRSGLILLEDARAVLARLEKTSRSVREAATTSRKQLRVGAIDSASSSFLPGVIAAFIAQNPAVDFRFVEAMTGPLMQMLETGKLDLVLCRPPRRSSDCTFEVLRVERPLVVLPIGHPLVSAPEITMHDLVSLPFVMPSKRIRPYAHDLVMSYFESVGASPAVSIEATEKPAIFSSVAAGLGVALAPDWLARFSFPGVVMRRLRGMLMDPPPPGAMVGVAWRPHQRLEPRDSFLELLRHEVALLEDDSILPHAAPVPQKAMHATSVKLAGMHARSDL